MSKPKAALLTHPMKAEDVKKWRSKDCQVFCASFAKDLENDFDIVFNELEPKSKKAPK
ncbi:MAG: hypothetical protein ACPG8A_03330 [Psychrobium sp.]